MNSKLYVGNVSFKANETELEELFGNYGDVTSVRIITDRDTGRSRGFAFVEMTSEEEAQKAIDGLDGHESFGRDLRVNLAQEKKPNDSAPRKW